MEFFLFLLAVVVFIFCMCRIVSTLPRAWRRRNEGGFWAAWNTVAKEDHERFLAKQLAQKTAKTKSARPQTPATDYDPETGEVYEDARLPAPRSRVIEKWEASLVQIWEGSEDIEFTYESRNGRVRRKVTLQTVLRNDKYNVYLRGFCHVRNEERTFSAYSILTKILVKGKRYEIEDFLSEKLGISDEALGWA